MIENAQPLENEIIIGGDFNFIFDKKLDAYGGRPELKLHSIAEVNKIISKFDLCDIFRIRNPEKKMFTFRKPTPRLFRRLDFFLCSNSLKDNILKTDIFASIESDHSPIVLSLGNVDEDIRGPSYWKFPAFLTRDLEYVNQLKELINITNRDIAEQNHQLKWEFIKYKIREFTIKYSKNKAKLKNSRKIELEKIIINYENTPTLPQQNIYESAREEYDQMLTEITNGHVLRTKTVNYQSAEKHSKYFLNLEKRGL